MAARPTRKTKAATLIALTLLLMIVLNWAFVPLAGKWSLLAAFLATTLLMWPVLHVFLKKTLYGKVFYKIDSKKGLKMIDGMGRRYSNFWTNMGDFALMVFFAGLGTAFVANHRGTRGRSAILAVLSALVAFVYLGSNYISVFPFGANFSPDAVPFAVSLMVGLFVYMYSPSLSKGKATIAAFLLGFAFFGSPYLLTYIYSGSLYSLLIGVSVGILGLPAIIIVPLLVQGVNIATGLSDKPGLNPGYPEMENGMPVLKYAGTNISIPFFPDILVAFIIMLALHELFHGLVARAQGIDLKHTGLIFLSIIPMGAFVEPDEKKFKKEALKKQMRVYAAGSFANVFVVALSVFLLANAMVSAGVVHADGFIVGAVIEGSAADGVIRPGEYVTGVGGLETPTFWDFSAAMKGRAPGESLAINAQNRTVAITLGKSSGNASQGFVGLQVYIDPIMSLYAPSLATSHIEGSPAASLFSLLKWIFFLNFTLGIMNLLPLRFFDGGYAYAGLFMWLEQRLPKGKKLHLAQAFSTGFGLVVIAIFVLNLSPYLL